MEITLENNRYEIAFNYNPGIIAYVKNIGGRFDGGKKIWWLPAHELDKVDRLAKKFCKQSEVTTQPERYGEVPPLPELDAEIEDRLKTELLRQPYHYQKQGIAYNLKNKRVMNADDMGGGKEVVNGTPVLSAKGWVPVESLTPGDQVCGKDGNLHKVTGVYPQGVKDIYRVTFSDGTFADAGLEHLWAVRSLNDRICNGGKWRVLNTEQIKNNLRYRNNSPIWEIPLCEPINYAEKPLQIPPYVLGTLIADGDIQKCVRFIPGDTEVVEIVKSKLPYGYYIRPGRDNGTSTVYYIDCSSLSHHPWRACLKQLGLNTTGEMKRIPALYLTSSIEQRKELLAGLMDGDGTVSSGRSSYNTSSYGLAQDVVNLVQSLGGMAVISKDDGRSRIRNGKECFEIDNYNVSVRLPFNPFAKQSARAKWKLSSKLIRNIVSIEYVCQAHATCIAVDAPDHLYIIKDHIVTHNTTTSISTVVAAGLKNKPGLIVCKGSGKYMWEREFQVVAGMKSVILTDSVKLTWYQFYEYMGVSVFITNYESLEKFFVQSVTKVENRALTPEDIVWRKHPTKDVLMKDLFSYVILDESHEIRNEDTLKSVICVGLGQGKEYRLALTGTPIVNKSKDIYAQLNFLGKTKNTKESKKAFMDRYCGGNGAKSTNSRELHYNLNLSCYFRRNKKEFGIDLPELTMQLVYSEITNRKEYNHCLNDLSSYLKNVRGKTDGQVEKSMNAEIMVQIQALMNISARGKLKDAIEAIDEVLNTGQKVVVGINQKEIKEALKKHYPQAYVISGEENAVEKNEAEMAFKNLQGPGLIIVSIKAGGVGINLQTASDIICVENPWHPAIFYQFIARVHRNGQKNKVNAKVLIGKDTFDERIWEIIESKKDIADTITGSDDSDIQRQVIDKVKESLFNPKNK